MQILYLDDHLVVVNKPAGLLVHRSTVDRHETEFALQTVRDLLGCRVYPVHRLDKPTSGALLFALSSETARRMTTMFAAGSVSKVYVAVVRGLMPEHGLIDYPLVERHDVMTDRLARTKKPAQRAITEYRRLGTTELANCVGRYPTGRYSLLRVMPKTGRRHQIRRHMKHESHPIIGDTTYGDGKHNRFFRKHFNCHRLMLAANGMNFLHPYTGEAVTIAAPLDDEFQQTVSAMGWYEVLQDAHSAGLDSALPTNVEQRGFMT